MDKMTCSHQTDLEFGWIWLQCVGGGYWGLICGGSLMAQPVKCNHILRKSLWRYIPSFVLNADSLSEISRLLLVGNQVQNLAIAKTKIEFWNRNWIVFNSILTAAYEFKTDVCAHALSCNARLSTMVLQWPCRCKVSSLVVYSLATCLQDTVCRLQYQYSWTRLYDSITFNCNLWHLTFNLVESCISDWHKSVEFLFLLVTLR